MNLPLYHLLGLHVTCSCDCITLALARLDQASAADIIVLTVASALSMQPPTQPSSLQCCTRSQRSRNFSRSAVRLQLPGAKVCCACCHTPQITPQTLKPHTQQVNKQQKRWDVHNSAVQTDLDSSSMSFNCLPRLLLEGIAYATSMPRVLLGSKDLAAQAVQLIVKEALCL